MAPGSSLTSWEKFLWNEYSAVAVPALNTDCQMLSVLVKRSVSWLHFTEVVEKLDDAWSITLDAEGSTLGCKEIYKAFKDQLSKGLKVEPDDYPPFSHQDLGDIEQVVKNSNSLGGLLDAGLSGAGKVEADLGNSKTLTVAAKGVFSHKFDKPKLIGEVEAGKWKPQAPTLLKKGRHVLWIINEVFYAESITISSHQGASVKAKVAAMPGIPGGLGAGVDASADKDAQLTINGGAGKGPRPFAFKALAFELNDGSFQSLSHHDRRPLPRSSGPNSNRPAESQHTVTHTEPQHAVTHTEPQHTVTHTEPQHTVIHNEPQHTVTHTESGWGNRKGKGKAKGKGKGKGKAVSAAKHPSDGPRRPAAKPSAEDFVDMSDLFHAMKEEGEHLQESQDFEALPIIFSAPAKDT